MIIKKGTKVEVKGQVGGRWKECVASEDFDIKDKFWKLLTYNEEAKRLIEFEPQSERCDIRFLGKRKKIDPDAQEIVRSSERFMEVCEACGAKKVKYQKRLNKPICNALILIYERLGVDNFGDIGKLKILSHPQKCNFQILRYWDLLKRPDPHDPIGRGGNWAVTQLGEKFIKEEITVPLWKMTYRRKVVEEAQEMVKITQIMNGYEDKAYHVLRSENVSDK